MKDINKDIENLEEIINLINEELDKKDKNVSAILDLKDLSSLRNLIKAYKELLELYKSEKKMKNQYVELYQDILLKENVIPVSLIKETIEELKKDIKNKKTRYPYILEHKIDILKKILKKRKKYEKYR